jgi:hypothetical protein
MLRAIRPSAAKSCCAKHCFRLWHLHPTGTKICRDARKSELLRPGSSSRLCTVGATSVALTNAFGSESRGSPPRYAEMSSPACRPCPSTKDRSVTIAPVRGLYRLTPKNCPTRAGRLKSGLGEAVGRDALRGWRQSPRGTGTSLTNSHWTRVLERRHIHTRARV